MRCDVGKATEWLENELWLRWSDEKLGEWALIILQAFRHFAYFANPSVASPTSQLILQPFRRFTHVTVHSPTLPLLHLSHSSFSNPSFASSTSQALHLRHLTSRPCNHLELNTVYVLQVPCQIGVRIPALIESYMSCSLLSTKCPECMPWSHNPIWLWKLNCGMSKTHVIYYDTSASAIELVSVKGWFFFLVIKYIVYARFLERKIWNS